MSKLVINFQQINICFHNYFQFQKYLPYVRDWQELKQRMAHIVQIIVKRHFNQFNEVDIPTCLHEYTKISTKKTDVVSLPIL